jgi:hypothetical protein
MNDETQDTDNTKSPDEYIVWEQAWLKWAEAEAEAFSGGWHSC